MLPTDVMSYDISVHGTWEAVLEVDDNGIGCCIEGKLVDS